MIIGEPNEPYDPQDYPHGLRCGTCSDLFLEGQRIYRQPESPAGEDVPVFLIICESCAGRAS